jgi:hypothetical protein
MRHLREQYAGPASQVHFILSWRLTSAAFTRHLLTSVTLGRHIAEIHPHAEHETIGRDSLM